MKCVKPSLYPHHEPYAYSECGFVRRVKSRLLSMGIKPREVDDLYVLYFGCKQCAGHQDATGTFRNKRKFRLYRLSRGLRKDRKRPLFDMVERSGLFVCFYDDYGRLAGFVSPRAAVQNGMIPVDRLG